MILSHIRDFCKAHARSPCFELSGCRSGKIRSSFQPPLATIMSDIFGAGSEDLDWTSDLAVSKPFTFTCLLAFVAKQAFSACRPLNEVKCLKY